MSTTPNEPQDPRSAVPGGPNAGDPRAAGHGGVDGAPTGQPYGEPQNPGQQYGQAGGKYGTAEYNPGQYTGMTERPSTIDRLLKLTLISLGLSVLGYVVSLIGLATVDMDALIREQGVDSAQANGMDVGALAGVLGTGSVIVGLVISIGLYLLVYFNLKKGRNWARILGTVFAAFAILSGVFGLFGDDGGMSTGIYVTSIVLGVIKIVVDILWIVTAYKAPTSAWFTQNQVQR